MATHPGWKPDRLRQARLDAGYTQEDLAEALRTIDDLDLCRPSATPETIRRHESGRSWPRAPYRRAYCHFFGATEADLGFRLPAATRQSALPTTNNGVAWEQRPTDITVSAQEEAATNRRDLLELLAATTGATLSAAIPTLTPADRLLALEATASGTSVLSLAEAQFTSVVRAYPSTTPHALLGQISAVQQLTDAIARLSLRPADQARLWRLAGITAGLRGWVHNNAGQTSAARVSLAEAHRRGELLDDPQLTAWTRYMQAIVEDYAGHPDAAEQYALDGLRHAPTGPQRAILLSDALAGARAARGDLTGADTAIQEARTIVHALTPEERGPARRTIIDDLTTSHPISIASTGSLAYARLGQPDKVTDLAVDTMPVAEVEGTHHRAYFRMDQALAVIRSSKPDPDQVATLAAQGLTLAEPFQTAHIGKRAEAIINAAVLFRGHPAITDLTDRTRTWQEQRHLAALPQAGP